MSQKNETSLLILFLLITVGLVGIEVGSGNPCLKADKDPVVATARPGQFGFRSESP